jgi:hypothetical protein
MLTEGKKTYMWSTQSSYFFFSNNQS